MKAKSVAGIAALGMLLTSVSVYSLTPAGGVAWSAPEAGTSGEATEEAAEVAEQPEPSRFTAGTTLAVEGRVGHPRLLKTARGETFVMLEVRGAETGAAKVTAPVNLSIVMDRSGSMKGTRLVNAISAATQAVDRLRDGDVVSVVTFDTRTQIVVPPITIGPGARERVSADIRGITLGGDTCISCGVEDGILEIERTMGKVNKMIVLSDGDANHGVRDVPGFRSIAQRARDKGISVTTIGVDVDYNEKILSALAQESNGRHYFVENDAALARVFAAEAESLTSTVASGAEAAIELAPGVELERVFDRSFRRAGSRVVVPLGAFANAEVKTVLLKVKVPAATDGAVPIADVELTYKDLVSGSDGRSTGRLATLVTSAAGEATDLDPVVAGRVQRSETAATLKEANALFARGKAEDARRRLDAQAKSVAVAASGAKANPFAAPRRADIDRDFESQISSLNRASSSFATPPPATPVAGAAPQAAPPAPEESRQGKGAVKSNQEQADAFGF